MRRSSIVSIVSVVLGVSFIAALSERALAQAPAPAFGVGDMLRLRRISDPQVSPDGTRVAFVLTEVSEANNTRNMDIWIVPAAGGEPKPLIVSDKSDDRPRWSPDGKRLAFVSTRDGGSQIWIADIDGDKAGPPRKLTSLATEASGEIWSPDGKWIAFTSEVYPDCESISCNAEKLKAHEDSKSKAHIAEGLLYRHWTSWKDDRVSHLLLMPADGSAPPRDLTPGRADVPPFSLGGPEAYAFSPDSKELAFTRKTDAVEAISTNEDLFTVDVTAASTPAQAKKITNNPAADEGPVYSPDGKSIAYRAQQRPGFESDLWRLMIYDRQSGQSHVVAPEIDRPIEDYCWTRDANAIVAAFEDEGVVALKRMDLTHGAALTRLTTAGAVMEFGLTPDGSVVFTATSLTAPAEIFVTPSTVTGRMAPPPPKAITHINDALLAPFHMRPGESVTYTGADGAKVQAWVIKPSNFKDGETYPALFIVHGGPQTGFDDAWSYRWNAQVFANAGYIVFMPNPRGSTGFGQRFTDDISKDWAGKVYDDLMRGADFLETLPYVDRNRIGAAGASYGGYMMNWLAGHTTRFKAIVTHAGLFNLESMYGATEELWFPEWEFGGTPYAKPELYEKFSPHRFVSNFKTPTLVTHGEIDYRVPVGEGLQMFTALQRQGVPSKLIVFPDEGHWILKPANSALWYRNVIDWLDKWVRGAASTTKTH